MRLQKFNNENFLVYKYDTGNIDKYNKNGLLVFY